MSNRSLTTLVSFPTQGEPFMERLGDNKPLVYSLAFSASAVLLLASGVIPEVQQQFELVELPLEVCTPHVLGHSKNIVLRFNLISLSFGDSFLFCEHFIPCAMFMHWRKALCFWKLIMNSHIVVKGIICDSLSWLKLIFCNCILLCYILRFVSCQLYCIPLFLSVFFNQCHWFYINKFSN